jgi:thioredoxin 1
MSSEIEQIRLRKMEEMMRQSASGLSSKDGYPDSPVVVRDTEFEGLVNKYPYVVVDCWAPWCGPCRMLAPTVDELARDYAGKVVFAKLNTDENIDTAGKYRIMSIPTLLFFKNGKLIDKAIGAMPRSMLESQVKKHL